MHIFGYVRDFYRLRIDTTYVPSGARLDLKVLNRAEVSIDLTK